MKKLSKYSLLVVLAVSMLATSCSKIENFGDTNVNPGGVGTPIPSALFTNVLVGIPGYASQTRGGLYAQYFSETQYTDASLYSINQSDFTGIYSGPLYDLQNVINDANSSNNLKQAARIVKSYIFWTVTDRWGDVPYSQALLGDSAKSPKYDKQEDIYKGMIAELTSAQNSFDETSVIGGDISSFNGSTNKWKKLANSLRALMSIQLSKRYPGANDYAATEFKSAIAAGVIEMNSDNWVFDFPGSNLANPWYNLYNGRKDFGESNTMVTLMTSLGDKRQAVFGADVSGKPSTVGVPYGWVRNRVDPWTSSNPNWAYILAPQFREDGAPVTVIAAAHISLARAEAADYGWTNENAWDMYVKGINMSHEQWGLAKPDAAYFTQTNVRFPAAPGTGANLRPIALQRYIAFYPDGLQGWNIWRKTGYPALTRAEDAVNSEEGFAIPRRYRYHPNEYGTNEANVREAVGRLTGGDLSSSRVWWDQ